MDKKLQIFVSSTYTDLIEERQASVEAILNAGHIPAGMELFKAGKSQLKTIYKWIDESDVYILILGGRYGSLEGESKLSYTELEYRYALSKDMPVFAIVIDESYLFKKAASMGRDAVFEKDNVKKYNKFKDYVMTKIVKFVSNTDKIHIAIHTQINYFLNDSDYNLIGWSRNHYSNDSSEPQPKIDELQQKIDELQQKMDELHQKSFDHLKKNQLLKERLKDYEEQINKYNIALDEFYHIRNDYTKNQIKSNITLGELKINNRYTKNQVNTNKSNIFDNILDKNMYEDIKSKLQDSTFRITLNPDEEVQKTDIQDCLTIFLNNYQILKQGVLPSKYRWQTGLLYAHVCPFLLGHNLVIEKNDDLYGKIYTISDIGVAFFEMAVDDLMN